MKWITSPTERSWSNTKKQSAKRVVNTAKGNPFTKVSFPAFLTLKTKKSIKIALRRIAENIGKTSTTGPGNIAWITFSATRIKNSIKQNPKNNLDEMMGWSFLSYKPLSINNLDKTVFFYHKNSDNDNWRKYILTHRALQMCYKSVRKQKLCLI